MHPPGGRPPQLPADQPQDSRTQLGTGHAQQAGAAYAQPAPAGETASVAAVASWLVNGAAGSSHGASTSARPGVGPDTPAGLAGPRVSAGGGASGQPWMAIDWEHLQVQPNILGMDATEEEFDPSMHLWGSNSSNPHFIPSWSLEDAIPTLDDTQMFNLSAAGTPLLFAPPSSSGPSPFSIPSTTISPTLLEGSPALGALLMAPASAGPPGAPGAANHPVFQLQLYPSSDGQSGLGAAPPQQPSPSQHPHPHHQHQAGPAPLQHQAAPHEQPHQAHGRVSQLRPGMHQVGPHAAQQPMLTWVPQQSIVPSASPAMPRPGPQPVPPAVWQGFVPQPTHEQPTWFKVSPRHGTEGQLTTAHAAQPMQASPSTSLQQQQQQSSSEEQVQQQKDQPAWMRLGLASEPQLTSPGERHSAPASLPPLPPQQQQQRRQQQQSRKQPRSRPQQVQVQPSPQLQPGGAQGLGQQHSGLGHADPLTHAQPSVGDDSPVAILQDLAWDPQVSSCTHASLHV